MKKNDAIQSKVKIILHMNELIAFIAFRWKRTLKKYLVSYPITMCFLAVSLWVYFAYYRIEMKTEKRYPLDNSVFSIHAKFMRMVPSAGYSLLIIPMNLVYKKVAILLTEYGKKIKTYVFSLYSLIVFVMFECFRKSSSSNIL